MLTGRLLREEGVRTRRGRGVPALLKRWLNSQTTQPHKAETHGNFDVETQPMSPRPAGDEAEQQSVQTKRWDYEARRPPQALRRRGGGCNGA
jgi:hypothetical protein